MGLLLAAVILLASVYLAGTLRNVLSSAGTPVPRSDGSRVRLKRLGRFGTSRCIAWLKVSVPVRTGLDFECRPETGTDRFFKESGYTVEHQVGHNAFDDRIYLVADDPAVSALLRQGGALTAELAQLFDGRPTHGLSLKRLRCGGGKLEFEYMAAQYPPTDAGVDALLIQVLPRMRAIAAALPSQGAGGTRPAGARSHDLIIAVVTALVINALVQLIRLRAIHDSFVIDFRAWWLWGSLAGVVLLAGLVLWTIRALRGGSRFHLALLTVLSLGGFGSWVTGMVLVRDLNTSLPHAHGQVVEMTVRSPPPGTGGGRAGVFVPRCGMSLFEVNPRRHLHRLRVPCVLQGGDRVATLRNGALGIAWVSVQHRAAP